MERNEKESSVIEKANFYKSNEIVAHVLTIPKGTFKNGRFVSELEQDKFFWFLESDGEQPIRLFLSEIFDIQDYQEKRW